MVRRNDHVAFMAGAYVFPGGSVDEGDVAEPAAAIDGLLADPAGLAAAGRAARRRFETRHRTEVAMPLVYEALQPLLDRSGMSGGSAA